MRVVAKVLRAAFRLILAVLVIFGVAAGVFHILEIVLTKPGPGGGEAARTKIYGEWPYPTLALVIGIALAVLCDRIWMRVRGLGPELASVGRPR